jgi:hypothetical protein
MIFIYSLFTYNSLVSTLHITVCKLLTTQRVTDIAYHNSDSIKLSTPIKYTNKTCRLIYVYIEPTFTAIEGTFRSILHVKLRESKNSELHLRPTTLSHDHSFK